MATRINGSHSGDAGDDYRIDATDYVGVAFHQHFYSRPEGATPDIRPEVEVQAFRHMSRGPMVVALCISGPLGRGETFLSVREAREVALSLLRSADDAERIITGR